MTLRGDRPSLTQRSGKTKSPALYWEIAVEFAKKLYPEKAKLFPYGTPEEIFNEHRETTRRRDLDITGVSYALLERDGPQQWPYPEGATSGRTRLYSDAVAAGLRWQSSRST